MTPGAPLQKPVLTAALAAPLLGERVGRRRWLGILAGFAGAALVLAPGLLGAAGGGGGRPDAAAGFFARHLRPWAARLFADLEAAEAARFYRAVGTLGRVAVEIEAAAADLEG